jgi:autotransporter translocation and assembly factor TamB
VIRIARRVLLILLAAAVLLPLGVLVVLHAGADRWLLNSLLRNAIPGATTSVGDVAGNYFSGVEVRDARIARTDGTVPLDCDTVGVSYDLRQLLRGNIVLRRIQVIGPHVVLQQSASGSWTPFPAPPSKPTPPSPRKSAVSVTIEQFSLVRGVLDVRPREQGTPLTLRLTAAGSLIGQHARLTTLSLQSDSSTVTLSGALSLPSSGERLDLSGLTADLDAERLRVRDASSFLPALKIDGSVQLKGRIRGNGSTVAIGFDAVVRNLEVGSLLGSGSPVRSVGGHISADFVGRQLTDLSGTAKLELSDQSRSLRGKAVFNQGRAQLELRADIGAAVARLTGWARPFDSVVAYDLGVTWKPVRKAPRPPANRWLNPWRRSIAIRLAARGLPPDHAVGRATVRIGPVQHGSAVLDSGSVDLHIDRQSARLAIRTGVSGGLVSLDGRGAWDSGLELWIPRGSVTGVNLGSLLGDASWSSLRGDFSLKLSSPPGGLQLVAATQLNGADLKLGASRTSAGGQHTLSVRQFSFEHLDLSRFRTRVPPTDLNGAVDLHAAGSNLPHGVVTASVQLNQSRLGKVELHRAQVDARLNRGAVQAEGEVAAPAGLLGFAVDVRPFDSVPSYQIRQLSFSDFDLGRLLQKQNLTTRLTGSLTSRGMGRKPEDAELSATLELQTSTVKSVGIAGAHVETSLSGGDLELIGTLRGRYDSVLIGAAISPFADRRKVKVMTRVPFAELAAFLQPDSVPKAEGAAYLAVSGELGRPDSMRLRAELQAEGSLPGVTLDSLGLALQLAKGVVRLDTLTVRSNVVTAAASGQVGWFGNARSAPARLRFGARLGNFAALTPYFGSSSLGLDSGTVTAKADGTGNHLQLALRVQGGGLTNGKQRVDQLAASGRAELVNQHLASARGEVSARGIRTRKRSFQSLVAQVTLHDGKLGLRGEALIDSRHQALIAARVAPAAQEDQLHLDTLNFRVGERHWALSHPVAITYGKRLEVKDLVLSAGAHRIAANGRIDPRGEQSFKVSIDSLPLEEFSQLAGLGELDGQLNAAADLAGPATRPTLSAHWDIDARARRKDVGRARGNLDWTSQGLKIANILRTSEGDSLTVTGRIPSALTLSAADSGDRVRRIPGGELAFDAVGHNVDLSKFQPLFNPDKIRDLEGRLSLDAHARGTNDAPRLSGTITVRDAQIRIVPLARYHHGSLDLRLEGQEARVVRGRFRSGDGEVDLGGKLGLDSFPALVLDVTGKLKEFAAISDDQLRATATGDVHLGGPIKNPQLSGTFRLHNTDFYLKAKNLQSSAERVELSPEDLRTLERRFGPDVASRSKKVKGFLPPWQLNGNITLGDNVWLRRRSDPVMAVELAGKLQIRKQPNQELNIFGQIKPLPGRSFVQLMSRRFDLRSGSVALNGPMKQARLGLDAEYRTTEAGGSTPVVIVATVKSDSGSLDVGLDSRPVMREADILSYLTTGRPASTDPTLASDEQGVLNTGAALAVGAALGSVAGKAGQQFGVDVVQVLQDRQGGQTVVAGKYVSPPLYLGFRQPIVPPSTSNRSNDTQQNAMELEMEYAALQDMLVNLQAGGSEMRVFLKLRR